MRPMSKYPKEKKGLSVEIPLETARGVAYAYFTRIGLIEKARQYLQEVQRKFREEQRAKGESYWQLNCPHMGSSGGFCEDCMIRKYLHDHPKEEITQGGSSD